MMLGDEQSFVQSAQVTASTQYRTVGYSKKGLQFEYYSKIIER